MFDLVVNVLLSKVLPLLCLISLLLLSARSIVVGGVLLLGSFLACVYVHNLDLQPILSSSVGINLYLMDAISSILLAAGILRIAQQGRPYVLQMFLFGFGVILIISLARGIIAYGLQAAGNDFRTFYYFISVALYFSTFSTAGKDWRYMELLWLGMGGILVLIATMRWMLVEVPALDYLWKGPGGYHIRVLPAYPTFILAQTLLILILIRQRTQQSNILLIIAIVLAIVVLLLQHRTVWAALLATGILVIWKEPIYRSRLGWIVLVGSFVLVILAYSVGPLLLSSLKISVKEPFGEVSSLSWRIEGWTDLVKSMNFVDVIVGKPFGGGYVGAVRGSSGDVSPHSLYITILYRSGFVGLMTFATLYIRLFRDIKKSMCPPFVFFLTPRVVFYLLAAQLFYGIAYFLHYEQGIILGISLAMGACQPVDSGYRVRSSTKKKNRRYFNTGKGMYETSEHNRSYFPAIS